MRLYHPFFLSFSGRQTTRHNHQKTSDHENRTEKRRIDEWESKEIIKNHSTHSKNSSYSE